MFGLILPEQRLLVMTGVRNVRRGYSNILVGSGEKSIISFQQHL